MTDAEAQIKGKSIILYANQVVLNVKSIDSPFKEEAKFYWIPIGEKMVENTFF